MKRFLYLFVCGLLSFTAMAQKVKSAYVIRGHIKNMPAKWVYLNIPNNKNTLVNIDSARVVNNIFVLSKDTLFSEPSLGSLIYKDSISNKKVTIDFYDPQLPHNYVNFILENAEINISGELKKRNGVSLSGSKETSFLLKYGLVLPPDLQKQNQTIDSLRKVGQLAQMAQIKAKKSEIMNNYRSNFKHILSENPRVWLGLKSLYQNASIFSSTELEELVKIIDPELMETRTGKKMSNYITQSKLLIASKPFIDFDYFDLNNKRFSLNQVKGSKGTLVIFWASWCGPCREEIPVLKQFYETYAKNGIAMVSVSADHDINSWKKALQEENMPWLNLSSLPDNFKGITAKYNVNAIPAMFLLDKDNKIVLADPNNFGLVKEKTEVLIKLN